MSASRNRFCFMLFVMTVAVGVTADGLLAAAQQEKEKTRVSNRFSYVRETARAVGK